MTHQETFNETQKKASLYNNIGALLYRDMDAIMPVEGHKERAEQMSLISGLSHELMTSQEYKTAVMGLMEQVSTLDPTMKRRVQLAHKELMINQQLSTEFVTRRSDAHNAAHTARTKARKENDFASFAPYLQTNLDLDRKYVQLIGEYAKATPYDTMLDIYEEGIDTNQIDQYFGPIKDICKKIIKKHKNTDSIELTDPDVSLEKKKEFIDALVDKIGFVRSAGVTGVVTHPFMTTIGSRDMRINTRYIGVSYLESIYSMIHELGHGLYEQYCAPEYYQTNLSGGVSLGVHESQSRYLENILGRSPEFVGRLCTQADAAGVPLGEPMRVHGVLHHVEPSYTRVEADEVTYNLHVIIRYEIEQALFDGSLEVAGIPERRNMLYKEYLGVEVPSDTLGCLQDVHWTRGFGYFPTYVIGNVYGAELHEQMMQEHPDLFAQIGRGEFGAYIDRSREHIWQHGSRYSPLDLMQRVTGKNTSSEAFVRYLEGKYL